MDVIAKNIDIESIDRLEGFHGVHDKFPSNLLTVLELSKASNQIPARIFPRGPDPLKARKREICHAYDS